ncbi:MAG: c-type cytochrome biogenesis protein CcmI [Candidatus Polarisedimenticolaceae bacterium]|nr:c-type cytochrome biogenesis protein CcmI [Candidatus Polarisedimenticolaceae bacterium]
MTLFWITAAALTAIAILFVVLPILKYKKVEEVSSDELNIEIIKQQLAELEADMEAGELEEEQYTASRHDLEKALLADLNSGSSEQTGEVKSGRWVIYAIPVFIIAIALPSYFKVGNPDIIPYLDRPASTQHQGTAQGHAQQRAAGQPNTSMEELVVSLAERMESDPENIEGWKMLGRSYISMGRIHDALQTYERALNLDRKDVDLLMGYATTLAMSRDNQFQGLPSELIDQAYQIAPQNPNVLWLKGNIHYQAGDFQQAIVIWEKVMAKLQPGSEEATTVADYIKDARSRLPAGTVAPVAPPASATESSSSKATAAEAIRVIVSLDPALQDKIQGNETLFIFARPVTGPRVPLAVVRKKASDLPVTLIMDDSMAMSGQLSLSKYPQVKVEARITKSGKPSASSGDLEGLVSPVEPGQAETVNLIINTVNP